VSGWRRRFEQQAGPVVVVVSQLPRVVPFLVGALLLVAGLLVKGVVGGLLLLLLAGLLGGLLVLSWPALRPGPRVVRLLVLALLVGEGVGFLFSK
jgi:hypothetical protein